ncbi:MAG: HAD family hydrolase [Chitinivibrionales bacterium]|nr:HAD family hydrolase [Chitinivibrionales bacterium]
MKKKAVFLDRDGVINEDSGYPYLPEHIVFKPGIFEFCRAVEAKGYILIVVTNQAGIAYGYFGEKEVDELHEWMVQQFKDQEITIHKFYYCPFHEKAVIERFRRKSEDRKPNPGMVLKASREFNIDIGQSIMIGDKESDRIRLKELRTYILKSKYVSEKYDIEGLDQVLPIL